MGIATGIRESPQIKLSPVGTIQGSNITWEATLNGQTLTIETRVSTDGGSTWTSWTSCTNGNSIPDLPSDSSSALLECRQVLSTNDSNVSPELHKLIVEISGDSNRAVQEAGADVTYGKSLTSLVDRVADNIDEGLLRKWAKESGADVTTDHQGDIQLSNLGEKSMASLTDKIADYISETTNRRWAAESGADITEGKSMSVLIDRIADNIAETTTRKWAAETGATDDSGWRHADDVSLIDGGKIYAGSYVQIGNLDGISDYCRIDQGDIEFFYYFNGSHKAYKSLKRVEYMSAVSGSTVLIPGYWKQQPKIIVSPAILDFYIASKTDQDQRIECNAKNIVETSPGVWQFDAIAENKLSDGTSSTSVEDEVSVPMQSGGANTITVTTTSGVISITVSGSWDVRATNNDYWDGQCGYGDAIIDIDIYVNIDGTDYLADSHYSSNYGANDKTGSFTKTISVSAGAHDVYVRQYNTRVDNFYSLNCVTVEPYAYVKFESMSTNSAADTVNAEGTLNCIAIGE